MGRTVFVSYCHKQGEWVWDRLEPCLKAGGADVRIDRDRFKAGKSLVDQMDVTQDAAELSVLVLSPDYLDSENCRHEMNRAIDRDPDCEHGLFIPVMREKCELPERIKQPNPLYVNLCDDGNEKAWDRLLKACKADLGTAATDWLRGRDEVRRYLQRNQSVNLVVYGNPKWEELIRQVRSDLGETHQRGNDLGIVDLESGATSTRRALVAEILQACGAPTSVPPDPEDLVALDRVLSGRSISRLALIHFDRVLERPHYDVNLFSALRNLIMTRKKLVLLVQSRTPFAELLRATHPLSTIDLKTVELRGHA